MSWCAISLAFMSVMICARVCSARWWSCCVAGISYPGLSRASQQPPHPRIDRSSMKLSSRSVLLFSSLAALLGIAVWYFAYRKKPVAPIADYPRLSPGVVMRDVTFRSQALQRDMDYRVFMPGNTSQKKLAVIYLLHGGGGSFRDWSNYSNVAQYAAQDFLLVMPQGDYSYYTNAALRPQDRYEDYIVHDLPADVEARFPARTDREGRVIAGVS